MSSSNPLNLPTKTYTELIVSNRPATPGEHVVFLYGALMHPMIIRQTIARDTPNLEVAPAALDNHTRLHVANEEYPALLPSEAARKILRDGRLREEDTTVRGVLVKGLTQHDVEQLDEAQGSKYSRKTVQCTPLSTFMPLSSVHSRQVLGDLTSPFDSSTTTTAYAYMWNGPIDQLTSQVWTFDGFLEENVYSWFRRIPPETHEQSCDFRSYHLVLGPVGGEGMVLPVMLRGEAVPEVK